jgi:hypothetical protein
LTFAAAVVYCGLILDAVEAKDLNIAPDLEKGSVDFLLVL